MIKEVRKGDPSHPEGLSQSQEHLAGQLFDIGAVKFGQFKLKVHERQPEAPLSPIYIDLRLLRRFPDAKNAAVDVYEELLEPLEFDLIADVPTAATPIASSLADRLGIGMITPRTDSKTHGTGAKIDGLTPDDKGRTAVILDDLVTGADSKIEAAEILRAAGVKVTDVVVLIDRKQGGEEQLREHNLRLHSSFTMDQMLDYFLRVGKISQEEFDRIKHGVSDLTAYLETHK